MKIANFKLQNAKLKQALPVIKTALREDIGRGDITSRLTVAAKKRIKAVIVAKGSGIVCGLDVARSVFQAVDRKISFRTMVREGRRVKRGKIVARIEGNVRSILKAERTALNFLARLSGIATLANKFIQRVKPYKVKIMDTRKTTPGLRTLEKYAVRCGGAFNHRMGLWDQVLVKDNHLSIVYSLLSIDLKDLLRKIKRRKPRRMKIEVEVKNLAEFRQALEAGPDIVMLDNMSIRDIKKAVKLRNEQTNKRTNEQTNLEVSGGINLNNVRKIAACGIERISVGALTHSAKAVDFSLNCEKF